MLKVNLDRNNGQNMIMGAGPMDEVLNDICTVINGLYSQMKRGGHEQAAEAFRWAMTELHTSPESVLFNVSKDGHGLCIVTEGKRDA